MSVQSVNQIQIQANQPAKNDDSRSVRIGAKLGAGVGLIQAGLNTFDSAYKGEIQDSFKKMVNEGKSKTDSALQIAKTHGKQAAITTAVLTVAGAAFGKLIGVVDRSEKKRAQNEKKNQPAVNITINLPDAEKAKKADKAAETEKTETV